MSVKYQYISFRDLNQVRCDELIRNRISFEVVDVPVFYQHKAVALVEKRIEVWGMTCRVYRKGRWVIGTHPLGMASIAVHNLATFNPDYEIRKELKSGIVVTCKKNPAESQKNGIAELRQILIKEEVEGLQIEYELHTPGIADDIAGTDVRIADLREQFNILNRKIDQLTNHSDYLDYTVAAAIGAFTGLIDSFFVSFDDGESANWQEAFAKELANTDDKFNKFVTGIAGGDTSNYDSLDAEEKKSRLQKAIRKLEKKYELPSDNVWSKEKGQNYSSTKMHHIDDFCHHPTIAGLLACIISELFKVAFFVDKNGKWHCEWANTPKEVILLHWGCIVLSGLLHWLVTVAERKYSEKQLRDMPKPIRKLLRILASSPVAVMLIWRIINWLGHLCSDVAGSSSSTGRGSGIPGLIIASLKELAAILPIPGLNNLINGLFSDGFDLRAEATLLRIGFKQAIPVLTNEVLVRGFYFIKHLAEEARLHGKEFEKYNWDKTLPFKNRTVIRMLTISHGTFVVADLGDAAVRTAISGQYTDPATFLAKMALRVNFVGIGRFTIAVYSDVKMAFRRKRATEERIKLHSEMLHLYNAKLFYCQENMWIAAKNAAMAVQQTNIVAETAIKHIAQRFVNTDAIFDSIDPVAMEEHNPGLTEDLQKLLD